MDETAEALDFMNQQHGLQHLDIKPANLFLVQNHVKIADFGLVRGVDALQAEEEGGVTPDYAAPELWLGGMSRYCDQYSLAIVFQELLTGTRPFEGKTLADWKRNHVSYPPNLSKLSPADEKVIARALAKKPKDRWGSCQEMVQMLSQAAADPASRSNLATPGPRLADSLTPVSGQDSVPIECPHCKAKGRAPVAFQGRSVTCKGCGKSFAIPEPPSLDIPDDVGLSPVEEALAPAAPGKEPEVVVEARCPRCSFKGYVPEKFVGRKIKCRKCSTIFPVAAPVRKK
jgi:serine/threonine protein kinase